MKPETKLKVAAEEIKEILRKHDIAGVLAKPLSEKFDSLTNAEHS